MNYHLEELDSGTFEKLVNSICQDLLGMGVISFAPGKDGGRDGKFTGSASKFPSNISPTWSGKFIIQAKHVSSPVASCSDKDFEKIVDIEIVKLKKLKAAGDVDCYIIFTNRKYSGIVGEAMCKKISKDTGIKNVAIIGKETINDLHLNGNKSLVKLYGLDKLYIPFGFSDEEIKDIIIEFRNQLPNIKAELVNKIDRVKYDFNRIALAEKNRLNQLGDDYFTNVIVSRSLPDFDSIQSFLENPINEDLKDQYFDIAAELSQIITIKRGNFDAFEEIFLYIYQLICDGQALIRGTKRHVLTLLHYMYFECLIGVK